MNTTLIKTVAAVATALWSVFLIKAVPTWTGHMPVATIFVKSH